jgi:3-isopropylmalate dehydrogenase
MKATISLIKGDGIGVDVSEAAIFLAEKAMAKAGIPAPQLSRLRLVPAILPKPGRIFNQMAKRRLVRLTLFSLVLLVFLKFGMKMEPKFRRICGFATDISFMPVCGRSRPIQMRQCHLPTHAPGKIDLVIIRESTEGLFYSAAVHGRSKIIDNAVCDETLRITRATSEKLHDFAFRFAAKRKDKGHKGQLTCVD